MRNRLSSTAVAFLALAFPMAVLADVSNTVTLSSGQHFSFDTGTAGTSGGDIAFTGTSITFVGNAAGYSFGIDAGSATYSELTSASLQFFTYSATPITGSSFLGAGAVFLVHTNGGNFVKVLINTVSSTSLAILYDAYGVTGTGNTPTITAVLDAGSYTANIAEGSVFVVKGSAMSAAGLTETSFTLPTLFGGVSITFTPASGGTGTLAYIVYLDNQSGVNQLAAILPSSVPAGNYNVTVTYNSAASAPFAVTVVKQKPSLITADSTGNGMVVVQNYVSASETDVNRFTTGTVDGFAISPAHPGQTEIAYSVGMGPDPGSDNQPSPG
jgi:uncharacterized protein (TIGR03437 family)